MMGFVVFRSTVMHHLSEHQRQALLENPNVKDVTDQQILYHSTFKIKAVEVYLKGKHPDEIFRDAGIDPLLFEDRYCYFCLKRWKKKYKDKGRDSLKLDERGHGSTGRPKNENLDNLTYEELQVIVQIQREVIEELKKKRALAKKQLR